MRSGLITPLLSVTVGVVPILRGSFFPAIHRYADRRCPEVGFWETIEPQCCSVKRAPTRPVVQNARVFMALAAGRLPIGRRLTTCPTSEGLSARARYSWVLLSERYWIKPEFNRSHNGGGSPLAATQRDRPRREPARLAISAKDRNAALTAAAFGNSSATSGAMTTTLELARSCSVYFPRTNAPKSERLYSERSSSAATVLAFLIELAFRSRRKRRGDDPNYVVIWDVCDHQQTAER
jgi:hypothetical protein